VEGLAEMGFLGVAIPEDSAARRRHLELCVIAEEMGRALAPVPFSSTVYLRRGSHPACGKRCAKRKWLPLIASVRDRHAGVVRRQGQPVAGRDKTLGGRWQPQRGQEAGARRGYC